MEPEVNNNNKKSLTADESPDEEVSFSRVTAVATGWMLDFMFVSLCRRFKQGKFEEFNETLSTLQAICEEGDHDEKTIICAFLARVMHGKQLDVQFEDDDRVMPLMSAAKLWSKLEHTVADESLFKNITILLLVQSVSVCLEKGQRSHASSALKWFEKNDFPKKLIVKLTTIVTERETYHPFLMSFSFSRLLETINSYLDAYLEKNPSDYILKAATKMAQSSQNIEDLEDEVTQDGSLSEEAKKTTEDRKDKNKAVSLRTKRKLLSTEIPEEWQTDSSKKPFVSVKRMSKIELSGVTSGTSVDTTMMQKARKRPQKWTYQLDQYLKIGVKRHGQGKWSHMLMDFDFEGRTGTMLKDRWRVLTKANKVG
ncbi:telomeric repeat-binding factor 1 [Sebastes umbrosus]|uniref:telomeric repeat-binding factor 1 n=1 Tax=Sebastes umbrosus TaxID=72105 RepID=UPI0018A0F1FD|nr:telomeric repeat-binding factor 1 [Sebastes umbrosus]